MVGLGGMFFDPTFIGANNSEEAITAYGWLLKRLSGFDRFTQHVSILKLTQGLLTGSWCFWIAELLRLACMLHSVKDVSGLSNKVHELDVKVFKYYRRQKVLNSKKLASHLKEISSITAELAMASAFSRISDVRLHGLKGPDFYADGFGVEVRRIGTCYNIDTRKLWNKILKAAREEIRQGEIICLDVSSTPLGATLWSSKHYQKYDIGRVVKQALKFAQQGVLPIILYTYIPNTTTPIGLLMHVP